MSKLKTTWYYPEWTQNRLDYIIEDYGKENFKGKKVLELAGCAGYISAYLQTLGAEVLCVEGRQENITKINEYYPDVPTLQANLDTDKWDFGHWDIIINFGLVYHLHNYHKEHLSNCITNCDKMYFETVIFDSRDRDFNWKAESGFDQSLSGQGGAPSVKWVEGVFDDNKVKYTKISDGRLNGAGTPGNVHHYDWEEKYDNTYHPYRRKFWVVK